MTGPLPPISTLNLAALSQEIAHQVASQLAARRWWLAAAERLHDELKIPEFLPLTEFLNELPAQALVDLQQKQPVAGQNLLLPNILPGKSLAEWAILPVPLLNLQSAALLLDLTAPVELPALAEAAASQPACLLALVLEHASQSQAVILHRRNIELLHTLSLNLASVVEIDDVLDKLVEAALELTDADVAYLLVQPLQNSAAAPFSLQASRSKVDQPLPGHADFLETLVQVLIQRPWPLIIDNTETHPLRHKLGGPLGIFSSLAGLPILRETRQLGVLIITYLKPHAFRPEERYLLSMLTEHAALALENTRLAHSLKFCQVEVEILHSLAQPVSTHLDIQQVLDHTVQAVKQHFNASAATITLIDQDHLRRSVAYTSEVAGFTETSYRELCEDVESRVLVSGTPLYIPNLFLFEKCLSSSETAQSILVVPLKIQNQIAGTLSLISQHPGAFGAETERLLLIAGSLAANAIENARLYTQTQARFDQLQNEEKRRQQFAEMAAHELHSPLTYFRSYLDLLAEGELGEINPQQQRSLRLMQEKTRHLGRLIDDLVLLDSQTDTFLKPGPIDFPTLIQVCSEIYRPEIEKKHFTLELHLPTSFPEMVADADRLTQVLDNLLVNALRYGQAGGKIVITLQAGLDSALLTIFNQGEAIPADQYEHIFERYARGDTRQKGMGLGLTIVRRIVEAHGGQVWVDSEPGTGNTFYVRLPYERHCG